MPRTESSKTQFIAVRMSGSDAQALRAQAEHCELSISELIRGHVTGQAVTSRTDQETASSIDRLGRMLNHLYPKDKGWASPEERKRWWTLVSELENAANALRR